MLLIRFLFFALSIIVASAVIAERQLPSIHTVVSDLAVKVGAATSQIRSISSKGQETDTKIGDLINQIDNYLNRAISDLQNLKNAPAPPTQSGRPKRTIADRYARVSVQQKRQTAYEVQSLQARVVINIVDAVASLNPKKLPSMQYYINPLDGILANQITVFASRMGAIIVTNEVSSNVKANMDRVGLKQTKAAVSKYNRLR